MAFLMALAVSVGAVGMAGAAPPKSVEKSKELRKAVTVDGIMKHERQLQTIARNNGGTRASGTPGYEASRRYVASQLRQAGYKVTVQPFEFPFFEELAPTTFSRTDVDPDKVYADGTDFAIMEYSGSGTVTDAPVVPTNDVVVPPTGPANSTNSGCEAADFPAETAGKVALVQRGTCTFGEKAVNAQTAGAIAVIIFNEGQEGRTEAVQGTLGGPDVNIPVIGASFAVGQELYNDRATARVSITTGTLSEIRKTSNILADTPGGRKSETVVVGSHLDSVAEGPGMNDNGSGASTTLEIARQMSKRDIKPRNKIRFAFWGAEESGLLGATYYVSQLNESQLRQISLNLNFDMIGSPNFVRFVYDGDGSAAPDSVAGPKGSARIEKVFNDYFASQKLKTEPTAFDGRSDYGPFIEAGIPAGGLFSGAEEIKTAREARIYGGKAGVAYDKCYHQACDNLKNLNLRGLNQLSDGAAHATYTFAAIKTPSGGPRSALGFKGFDSGSASAPIFKGPDARTYYGPSAQR